MADMDISLRRVIATAVNVEDAVAARDAAIFDARAAGQSLRAIADAAGVSHETVRSIVAAERARRTPPFTPNSTPLGPNLSWMTQDEPAGEITTVHGRYAKGTKGHVVIDDEPPANVTPGPVEVR